MEDKRVSRKRLEVVRGILGQREMSILTAISKYKYVTTGQIRRLFFTGGTEGAALRSANRTLARLRDLGAILPLARRIGGVRAGSGAFIWALSAAGVRLLALSGGDDSAARKRHYEPSMAFLTHILAVTETAVRFMEWARIGKISLLSLQVEPETWRQYAGLGGAPKHLKPDLFTVTASGEYEDHYFIEIDLATESPAVVIRKCHQYIAYRNTGTAQREHGVFPFVVWLVPDNKRKESLKRHISGELGNHAGMFIVITMDELEPLVAGEVEGLAC